MSRRAPHKPWHLSRVRNRVIKFVQDVIAKLLREGGHPEHALAGWMRLRRASYQTGNGDRDQWKRWFKANRKRQRQARAQGGFGPGEPQNLKREWIL